MLVIRLSEMQDLDNDCIKCKFDQNSIKNKISVSSNKTAFIGEFLMKLYKIIV